MPTESSQAQRISANYQDIPTMTLGSKLFTAPILKNSKPLEQIKIFFS